MGTTRGVHVTATGYQTCQIGDDNRINFEKGLFKEAPDVLVALSGLHAGTPGGVVTCSISVSAKDKDGFNVSVREAGSVANVQVSWLAIS